MNWFNILLTLTIKAMSKKSRGKKKSSFRINRYKTAIENYRQTFPLSCNKKTLREIIHDYCEILKENPKHYLRVYTEIELNSVLIL